MAAKNITTETATGNGVIGAEGAVDGAAGAADGTRPAGTAGAVWDALTGNPGAPVTAIAAVAGVSRATAARLLTGLESDGRAVRTRGGHHGGKQQPDTWHAADAATDDTATDDTATGAAGETGTSPDGCTPDASGEGSRDASPVPVDTTGTDEGDGDTTATDTADESVGPGLDPAAVAEARDALTTLGAAVTAALAALDAGDGDAALSAVEGAYSGSGLVRRLVRTAARGPVRTASGRVRSQPGAMRAKVAGHLDAHPDASFTPHEMAKVIGHSAGAVSNALDRLAESGDAELVCERPRRFTTTHRAATTGAAARAAG